MSARRFIVSLILWTLALAALVASFNWFVNPYLLFDAPRHAGFNSVKPSVETHERMMKAYQSTRIAARTLILGSSRVDIGMDPESKAWPTALRPVYDLGLAGSDTLTGLRYLRHAMASLPPGSPAPTVVIGLDFEEFLYRPTPASALSARPVPTDAEPPMGEVEQRLVVRDDGQPNPARHLRMLRDYALGTLSLDALSDSLKSIAASRSTGWPDLNGDGRLSDAPMRRWVASDGVDALFAQKNIQMVQQYASPHRVMSDRPDQPPPELAPVARLLDLAGKQHQHVLLAIQPAHASRLELIDRMGYWPDYERMKSEVTRLVDAEAARGVDVQLYDFGGYDPEVLEPIPAPGDRSGRLRWFWDPVHYTTALGDRMIATMLGGPTQPAGSGFGTRLTANTLADRLAQVRRDRAAYRQQQPAEVLKVQRLLCSTAGC